MHVVIAISSTCGRTPDVAAHGAASLEQRRSTASVQDAQGLTHLCGSEHAASCA